MCWRKVSRCDMLDGLETGTARGAGGPLSDGRASAFGGGPRAGISFDCLKESEGESLPRQIRGGWLVRHGSSAGCRLLLGCFWAAPRVAPGREQGTGNREQGEGRQFGVVALCGRWRRAPREASRDLAMLHGISGQRRPRLRAGRGRGTGSRGAGKRQPKTRRTRNESFVFSRTTRCLRVPRWRGEGPGGAAGGWGPWCEGGDGVGERQGLDGARDFGSPILDFGLSVAVRHGRVISS
jgi:hypothetical protein